jgi:hypothetical protein
MIMKMGANTKCVMGPSRVCSCILPALYPLEVSPSCRRFVLYARKDKCVSKAGTTMCIAKKPCARRMKVAESHVE